MLEDGIVHEAGLLASLVGFAKKQLCYGLLLPEGEVIAQVLQQHLGLL